MKGLISRILASEPFRDRPPICVDVGASGELPGDWRLLARHSTCIAFDADSRDFQVEDSAGREWKRLVKLNRLVAEQAAESVEFYLTKSPHCSSRLQPDNSALEPWAFSELFEVEQRISLPAISLPQALNELGISYIDWFKTDSQGTDLRILASLSPEVIDQMIVADFEPGILDAYQGEDKLFSLMAFMSTRPFFVSELDVKGTQRIGRNSLASLGRFDRRFIRFLLKKSPGWAEISYLNTFDGKVPSSRDLLLGWICSFIKGQHGHAVAIAEKGIRDQRDPLFEECRRASVQRLRRRYPNLAVRAAKSAVSRLLPK